jgi:hypothetical protein
VTGPRHEIDPLVEADFFDLDAKPSFLGAYLGFHSGRQLTVVAV